MHTKNKRHTDKPNIVTIIFCIVGSLLLCFSGAIFNLNKDIGLVGLAGWFFVLAGYGFYVLLDERQL